MNPETNKFEELSEPNSDLKKSLLAVERKGRSMQSELLRPDGTPVPQHWSVFCVDELVVIKNYTFKIAYINESTLVLEPVSLEIPSGDSG